MKLFKNISLENKMIGAIIFLVIITFLFIFLFIYQPNQKQNNLMMELKCKEIADDLYEKAREQSSEIRFFVHYQYGFNGKLNTCIYSEESTWSENEQHHFFYVIKDSIQNNILLSGYDSDTYQKDIFENHMKDNQEITLDEYKKLKEELLDK